MVRKDFDLRYNAIMSKLNATSSQLEAGYQETARVRKIVENTEEILEDLDTQFCEKTGLTTTDMNFLFVAIGMQIARQYLVTKFPERLDDQTSAKNTKGHVEEHSNRNHRYYNPSLEEIITNPVPFDANVGSNGALRGGGQLGHRATAIGHDPVLGLIFGTANIATSTLTTSSFESYHIYTNDAKRDYFWKEARTDFVITKTLDKLINKGWEGKTIVAASLMKEIVHLKSDIHTKNSLPLPFISSVDLNTASTLAQYGFDMSNIVTVGKQASYAMLINSLIAMVHGLFYDGSSTVEKNLYQVRTRKILSYSNLVASSSNMAVVGITGNMNLLDVGGLAVTIHRIITDQKFIQKVKKEFIFGSYRDMINGNEI